MQFFFRTTDADVERFLKLFTLIPIPEIATLMAEQNADPSKRPAQRRLAHEVIAIVYGLPEAEKLAFEQGLLFRPPVPASRPTANPAGGHHYTDINAATNPNVPQVNAATTTSYQVTLPASILRDQPMSRILYAAGLSASKAEGQRLVAAGGAYVSGRRGHSVQMQDDLTFVPIKDPGPGAAWPYVSEDETRIIMRVGKWKVRVVKLVSDEEWRERGLEAPGVVQMMQHDWSKERGVREEREKLGLPEEDQEEPEEQEEEPQEEEANSPNPAPRADVASTGSGVQEFRKQSSYVGGEVKKGKKSEASIASYERAMQVKRPRQGIANDQKPARQHARAGGAVSRSYQNAAGEKQPTRWSPNAATPADGGRRSLTESVPMGRARAGGEFRSSDRNSVRDKPRKPWSPNVASSSEEGRRPFPESPPTGRAGPGRDIRCSDRNAARESQRKPRSSNVATSSEEGRRPFPESHRMGRRPPNRQIHVGPRHEAERRPFPKPPPTGRPLPDREFRAGPRRARLAAFGENHPMTAPKSLGREEATTAGSRPRREFDGEEGRGVKPWEKYKPVRDEHRERHGRNPFASANDEVREVINEGTPKEAIEEMPLWRQRMLQELPDKERRTQKIRGQYERASGKDKPRALAPGLDRSAVRPARAGRGRR